LKVLGIFYENAVEEQKSNRKDNSAVLIPIFVFCQQKTEKKKSKKEDIIK
jgi:hypothetical protein